ncbi:unnamed protein product [Spirodela intermedia]|uniref:Phytocyanin domain-containing protein n=1 Tax=Spirodela intermedia TaxID=51605 RepID=A0ABN7ECM9_SPIIN|nr:unnamed protein product [Spirodela intermedia]CAA6675666.1 unnamed protein product [Spirodela intermedia]
MASSSSSALLFLILAVVYSATGALAATFQVGDNQMWSIPSSSSYYTDWANGQTFAVGDSLGDEGELRRLHYVQPHHDAQHRPGHRGTHRGGTRYFICGVNGHCSAGQKMALTVAAASTPSGTPPPPPSSGAPTPPTTVATPGPSGSTPERAARRRLPASEQPRSLPPLR